MIPVSSRRETAEVRRVIPKNEPSQSPLPNNQQLPSNSIEFLASVDIMTSQSDKVVDQMSQDEMLMEDDTQDETQEIVTFYKIILYTFIEYIFIIFFNL